MNSKSTVDAGAFAGFWQRLGAFAIDVLVIAMVGLAIGRFFVDELVQIGAWGRLIGFVVAGLYFGILNSKLTGGQTPGKRLLNIKVVSRDGAPLPLPTSLLRYIPLGLPWFLNNAQFPMDWLMSPLLYLLALLIFGLGLACIYLFIFNRPSRQVLHDLVAHSYVVRAEAVGAVVVAPTRQVHLIVAGVLIAISAALPLVSKMLIHQEPFAGLLAAYQSASAEPSVYNVQVSKGWSSTSNGQVTYVTVQASIHDPAVDDVQRAKRLARRVIEADPSVKSVDVIQVVMVYGYDLGFTSYSTSQTHSNPPAAWLVD